MAADAMGVDAVAHDTGAQEVQRSDSAVAAQLGQGLLGLWELLSHEVRLQRLATAGYAVQALLALVRGPPFCTWELHQELNQAQLCCIRLSNVVSSHARALLTYKPPTLIG